VVLEAKVALLGPVGAVARAASAVARAASAVARAASAVARAAEVALPAPAELAAVQVAPVARAAAAPRAPP